jgi:hypothetical protein
VRLEKWKDGDPSAAAGMCPIRGKIFSTSRSDQRKIRMQPKRKLKRSDQIAYIFLWVLGILIAVLVILLLRGCG